MAPNPAGPRLDASAAEAPELSLYDLLLAVRRRRRLVLGVPLAITAIVVLVTLVWPRTYVASTTFYPQKPEGSLAPLAGLAAQFGVALPGAQTADSPEFYASLLTSREILGPVVDSSYEVVGAEGRREVRLADVFEVTARDSLVRRQKTIRRLRKRVDARVEFETGLVQLGVEARDPRLAFQIVQRMVAEMSDFNLARRRQRASSERRFLEERLNQLAEELRSAERRHEAFLQKNREYRNSPQLTFENGRLAREVDMHQAVYTSFAQAYEQARVDEVRNTPVLTLVERPVLPAEPAPRQLLLKAVLALSLSLFVVVAVALTQEVFHRQRQATPDAGPEGERARVSA